MLEDDLSFGAVLKSYLEICNFSVKWLDDGKHAFTTFKEGTFDLCLLDVMLPNTDGFSIGRGDQIHRCEYPHYIPNSQILKGRHYHRLPVGRR